MSDSFSPQQITVIHDLQGAEKPLSTILQDGNLPDWQITEWMDDPAFNKTVIRMIRAMNRLRELLIARNGVAGARHLELARIGDGFASRKQRQACVDSVKLARAKVRGGPTRELPPGIQRIHPDAFESAQQLIDRLQVRR